MSKDQQPADPRLSLATEFLARCDEKEWHAVIVIVDADVPLPFVSTNVPEPDTSVPELLRFLAENFAANRDVQGEN